MYNTFQCYLKGSKCVAVLHAPPPLLLLAHAAGTGSRAAPSRGSRPLPVPVRARSRLELSIRRAHRYGFKLGVKLVRGAYMVRTTTR